MAKRGRKSAAALEIEPIAKRIAAAESPSAPAKVPKHLRMEGAAFFREMLAEYAIADAGGLSVLCRAAECVDRMAAARASIAKDGEIIQNQYNVPKMNPACVLEKQARDGFYAAMRLLSLDIEAPEPRAYRPWEPRQGAEAPW